MLRISNLTDKSQVKVQDHRVTSSDTDAMKVIEKW